MHNYKILSQKGSGAFSQVYRAVERSSSQECAIKVLNKRFASQSEAWKLYEVEALWTVNGHHRIVHVQDVIYESHGLFIVMELMDMNLYEAISGRTVQFPEEWCTKWVTQLFEAVTYLHTVNIFHRDIKPENCLLKGNDLKLADFGHCNFTTNPRPYSPYVSTRWYRAPECILTSGYYGEKMDVWAVACVYYEVLTLKPLFPGTNSIDQINRIHQVLGTPNKTDLNELLYLRCDDSAIKSFPFYEYEGSGLEDPLKHRSTIAVEVLQQLLVYSPTKRPTASQAYDIVKRLGYVVPVNKQESKSSGLPPQIERKESKITKALPEKKHFVRGTCGSSKSSNGSSSSAGPSTPQVNKISQNVTPPKGSTLADFLLGEKKNESSPKTKGRVASVTGSGASAKGSPKLGINKCSSKNKETMPSVTSGSRTVTPKMMKPQKNYTQSTSSVMVNEGTQTDKYYVSSTTTQTTCAPTTQKTSNTTKPLHKLRQPQSPVLSHVSQISSKGRIPPTYKPPHQPAAKPPIPKFGKSTALRANIRNKPKIDDDPPVTTHKKMKQLTPLTKQEKDVWRKHFAKQFFLQKLQRASGRHEIVANPCRYQQREDRPAPVEEVYYIHTTREYAKP